MKRKVAAVLMQMQEKHRFMKGLIHWMGFAYLEVPVSPPRNARSAPPNSPSSRLIALGKDCLFSFFQRAAHPGDNLWQHHALGRTGVGV